MRARASGVNFIAVSTATEPRRPDRREQQGRKLRLKSTFAAMTGTSPNITCRVDEPKRRFHYLWTSVTTRQGSGKSRAMCGDESFRTRYAGPALRHSSILRQLELSDTEAGILSAHSSLVSATTESHEPKGSQTS